LKSSGLGCKDLAWLRALDQAIIDRASIAVTSQIHITSYKMARNTVNSETISNITAKKKEITQHDDPVEVGLTDQAQKHSGTTLGSDVISDIT
jgi:hypothetical protein